MLKLQNKIEIIIPVEDNNGKHIMSYTLNDATREITRVCGGCTVTDVTGKWFSTEHNHIMTDNNKNFEWYYMAEAEAKKTIPFNISRIVGMLLFGYGQEAVSIKVNGVLYIIDRDDSEGLTNKIYELMF